jgi:lysophospholipase L1-like esterase
MLKKLCVLAPSLVVLACGSPGLAAPVGSPAPTVVKETIGMALRRAQMQADALYGQGFAPPLTTAPAWQANTAYVAGALVANGGNLYEAVTSGTSAASGGPTGIRQSTDGTVTWIYFGSVTALSNSAYAPTVTTGQANPSATLATLLTPAYNNTFSTLYGAQWYSSGQGTSCTSTCKPETFQSKAGTYEPVYFDWAFNTDAQKIGFLPTTTSLPYRIWIDGVQYSPQNLFSTGGGGTWTIIDWSSLGIRKTHRVEIEGPVDFGDTNAYNALRVSTNDQVWPTASANDIRGVMISDSICAGSSYTTYDHGLGTFARRIGVRDMWGLCKGGTGYINQGAGNAFYTFGQRVPQALALNPKIVFFMGSPNDGAQTAAAVQAAALAAWSALPQGGYTGPIVIIGILPEPSQATTAATLEPALQAAITQFKAQYANPICWIPLYGDPNGPIITGTGNIGAGAGNGNADIYNTDGTHPTDAGRQYLYARIAQAYKNNCLPTIN